MRIEQDRLVGEGVDHLWSPNHSGPFAPGQPDTLILHYTACATAASAIRTLMDPHRKVSSHLVIARDGAITQLLTFNTVGWHAGRSTWEQRREFNQFSLGIEIDNVGRLERRDGRLLTWFEREIDPDEAMEAVHRNEVESSWWQRYPAPQLTVVEQVCRLLMTTYSLKYVLGHEEIAPRRKVDPGPAFPLDEMRQRLLNPRSAPVAQVGAESDEATRRDSTS